MRGYKKIASVLLTCMSIFNGKTLALKKDEISKNNTKISTVSSKNHLSKIKKYGILGGVGAIIIAGIVVTTVCALKINNKKNSDDNNITKTNNNDNNTTKANNDDNNIAKTNNIEILLKKFSLRHEW